jgi:hypothetical protein
MYITQQVAVAKDGRILAAYAVDAKALPEHEYTKVAAQFSRPVSVAGNFDILVLFEGDSGVVAHRERSKTSHRATFSVFTASMRNTTCSMKPTDPSFFFFCRQPWHISIQIVHF